jgi:hypothetical protein
MITVSFTIDRIYWGVLILAPLGYGLLNFEAYKKTGRSYLFVLFILSLSLFMTTTLAYLMRHSDLIRGNAPAIQTSLLVITTIRVPLDLFFYSKLLKDLRTLKEGADHEELPILG